MARAGRRNAGRDPMGEALDAGDQLERQWSRCQHVERAVLIVVVEDAVGGKRQPSAAPPTTRRARCARGD